MLPDWGVENEDCGGEEALEEGVEEAVETEMSRPVTVARPSVSWRRTNIAMIWP